MSIARLDIFEPLTNISQISKHIRFLLRGLSNNIPVGFCLQVYYHWDGLYKNGTNISYVCLRFAVIIFCYCRILYQRHQNIFGINHIIDPSYMREAWNFCSLDLFVFLFVIPSDLVVYIHHCFVPP